jgi:hypothetical protein
MAEFFVMRQYRGRAIGSKGGSRTVPTFPHSLEGAPAEVESWRDKHSGGIPLSIPLPREPRQKRSFRSSNRDHDGAQGL